MPTILIIEDNDLNLKMARDLLQMAGFKTIEAEESTTGIQLAKAHQPDLILLDMYLPVKNGYEAAQELKSDPDTREIPIVAFTALAMDKERQKAINAGCCGFISKPIDVEQFAQTISSYLIDYTPNENIVQPVRLLTPKPMENEADLAVEEFFMIASHDLQTPLRKIDQFADMLKRSKTSQISAEDFEILERIERSTQQMHDLVSDMLTLSRINRNGKAFRMIDLTTVVHEAIRDNQAKIDKLDAELHIGPFESLEADPVQMQQLFQVLIDNGLKFRQPNIRPVVEINSLTQQAICKITIQDNGIGFSEDHCEKIFRPFVRLHGASSRYTGRGMGLAIAKKIIQRHNGTIKAEGYPDKGATFIITLPTKQSISLYDVKATTEPSL